jgi:hypothetical protein
MKCYICYDRYEHNEWFYVFHLGTNRNESIRHCKEVDLPDFICYGADDCHSFQLVEVEMTKKQYGQLHDWVEHFGSCQDTKECREFYDFMCNLYGNKGVTEQIIWTDGCSDFAEVVIYYSVFYKNKERDTLSDDEYDEYYSELCSDDELCTKVVREYVNDTVTIR